MAPLKSCVVFGETGRSAVWGSIAAVLLIGLGFLSSGDEADTVLSVAASDVGDFSSDVMEALRFKA